VRIALVSDTYTPQINGVTTVVRSIRDALTAAGYGTAVVAPVYPGMNGRRSADELRIPSVAFPPYPDIRLSVPMSRRVSAFLDTFGADLVHVSTEGPLGLIGRRYALRRDLPLVTSFHTDFPRYCRDYGVPVLSGVVWRWLTWFHRPARVTHTPGVAVVDELKRRGIGQAALWGRGVDTAWFHPSHRDPVWRRQMGATGDRVLVLHVGRLAPEKNVELLIEAWEIARSDVGHRAVFAVAGDGPMTWQIETRAPWIHRLGFLDRTELAAVYASADLCVLPSSTETYGLVALEAMASGLPVIAADAGGLRETVRHGDNGLLAPPTDPRAFAAAIVELTMEADRRREMGAAARATAEARDARLEHAELIALYAALTHARAEVHACTAA